MALEHRPAYFTCEGYPPAPSRHLYYFAPSSRASGSISETREVTAYIDIADDGTLAGVELIYDMPPPPKADGQ